MPLHQDLWGNRKNMSGILQVDKMLQVTKVQ